jgi:hypothetical protein
MTTPITANTIIPSLLLAFVWWMERRRRQKEGIPPYDGWPEFFVVIASIVGMVGGFYVLLGLLSR